MSGRISDEEYLLRIRAWNRELDHRDNALASLPPSKPPADAWEILAGLPEKLQRLLRSAPMSQRVGVALAIRLVENELRRFKNE